MKIIKELPKSFKSLEIDDVTFSLVSVEHISPNFTINEGEYINTEHGLCKVMSVDKDKGLLMITVNLVMTNSEKEMVNESVELGIQLALCDMYDLAFNEGFNECADSEFSNGSNLDNIGKSDNVDKVFKKYFV